MANVTSKANSTTTPFTDTKVRRNLAATAQTYYVGAMIALDASGNATKCDDTAGLHFDGIAAGFSSGGGRVTVDSGDAAGDKKVDVVRPWIFSMPIAAATAGDEGRAVYATFDGTVGYTSTNFVQVGWVDRVVSATEIEIRALYVTVPNKPIAITASGAVAARSQQVYAVTKAGVAALTLAAPTATTDDGLEIVITSDSAFAHTLTATGLLDTGTASVNLATFAAQKGAGLTLMAYNARWKVLASVGITFS